MAHDIRDRINAAIADGDEAALIVALCSGSHHGKPGVNAATKRWTAERLRQRDGDGSPAVLATALRLSASHEPMLRSIACALLARLWGLDRAAVIERAITLAADPDWEVREWAAGIFGRGLDADFDRAYPVLVELVGHPEPGVRRALALTAMQAADAARPERAAPLLALLEPLLTDRDDYVRKNLGPFALGDGLLRAYPDATFAALAGWANREDEITRWNVATACGSGVAARHPEQALPILESLAKDERPLVRRAVTTARKRHVRRDGD